MGARDPIEGSQEVKESFDGVEKSRVRRGDFKSNTGDHFGAFLFSVDDIFHKVICDDGRLTGWEHVSLSVAYKNRKKKLVPRLPTWTEMCQIKNMFWDKEEVVIQFHPAESEYVNTHNYVLHLWRKVGANMETPPTLLV